MAIINKPADYFNTKLYTGTGSSLANTGIGFQPDWVWIKGRSGATEHVLTDSVRGVTKELSSNDSGAEETVAQGLTAFGSDGFTVGTDASYNTSSATYVSWNWKAGGSASTNENGATASTVSANTTSGFSIVSYTGAGATTYGHGLGATPNVIIIKKRTSDSGDNNWFLYHDKVITAGASNKYFMTLNETKALEANGTASTFTSVSSTTFGVGTDDIIGESGDTFIAYCFAGKQGYSKFGSYIGNGNADGTFVYTGFKPAYVMVKRTSGTESWYISDDKRSTINPSDTYLLANGAYAEGTTSDLAIDLLSNGIKMRGTDTSYNTSGSTYIYMAFAENPFVSNVASGSVPVTAR